MKKLMLLMVFILAVSLFAVCKLSVYTDISKVYADEDYSEEDKAAAKAWLIAHGYPPTRAGAAQAYQDFLDGKLDDDPDVRRYKGLDKKDKKDKKGGNGDNSANPDDSSDGSSDTDQESSEEINLDAIFGDIAKKKSDSEEERKAELERAHNEFNAELIRRADKLKLDNGRQYILDIIPEKNSFSMQNAIIIILSVVIVLIIIRYLMKLPWGRRKERKNK